MINISHSLQESELRFSGEQGFIDKSPIIRLLIGIVFTFSLFLFLHYKEVRVDVLEPNTEAPRYVVAQVDFEFVDNDATALLQQQAVRDIGKIYRLVEQQVSQQRIEFENQLLKDPEWRRRLTETGFEEIYNVLDALQKSMEMVRFTDPRTILKMKEAGIPTGDFLIYNDHEELLPFPRQVWIYLIKRNLNPDHVQPAAMDFVLENFGKQTWKMEEDIPGEKQVRSRIQGGIPTKFTRVNAGSRLIDQGEKVTPRHIAMLQAMKKVLREQRNLWHPQTVAGSFLMAVIISVVGAAYLSHYHRTLFLSNRRLGLLVTLITLAFLYAKEGELFILSSGNLQDLVRYPLFVPLAAILACNLLYPSLAVFVAGFLAIIFTMTLSFDHMGFIVLNLVTGIIVILSTRSLRKRKEILLVCMKAWIGAMLVLFALHLYGNTFGGRAMLVDIISSAVFMGLTAMLAMTLLPILEVSFRIMSDVTLTEYMDPNNELLRRLAFEAPGTYQHTLVVGNLAEAAALAIGASGLFCRVAALYHDIGKMVTPHYFTENQQGEVNVHQLLTPLESAKAIISHVQEGVALAKKASLPEQIIDVIREHHGTILTYYFYRKQLDRVGGNSALVNEADFRYTGPKPHSKESVIIMIADSFEAASRSLDRFDEVNLRDLMHRLVREKAEDGQFDECQLTFEELGIVKETMIQFLLASSHSRIKYPERKPVCTPPLSAP